MPTTIKFEDAAASPHLHIASNATKLILVLFIININFKFDFSGAFVLYLYIYLISNQLMCTVNYCKLQ